MDGLLDALLRLEGKDVYLYCSPEILDFTHKGAHAKFAIHSEDLSIEIPLPANDKELKNILASLSYFLQNSKNLIIAWNIKSFYTYVLGRTEQKFGYEGPLLDLKILENFNSPSDRMPKTFQEARTRLASLLNMNTWESCKYLYKELYRPLIFDVLPSLETEGMIDIDRELRVFSYYEIIGTVNGRLTCKSVYKNSYMPHGVSIGKTQLKSSGYNEVLMYFDFKNQEVSVLQWLTGDPVLGEVLSGSGDVYEGIWRCMTGLEPNEKTRQNCKLVFLPIMYGLGAYGVSKKLEISEGSAAKLIDLMYKKFSVAMNYLRDFKDKNGIIGIDKYGRKRMFQPGEEYVKLNFAVASPAAVICLHKLVELHRTLKRPNRLAFHLHDGYCIISERGSLRKVYEDVKNVLTSDHPLYPNLKLNVSCLVGDTIATLKKYP